MSVSICSWMFSKIQHHGWSIYLLVTISVYIYMYTYIYIYIYLCQMHMLTRNCMCLTSDDGSRTGISSPIPWINWHAVISIILISVEKIPTEKHITSDRRKVSIGSWRRCDLRMLKPCTGFAGKTVGLP